MKKIFKCPLTKKVFDAIISKKRGWGKPFQCIRL